MTNNELQKADLLDILFEHRNKAYGAYALRRNYDKRLLAALGSGLALVATVCFLGFSRSGDPELTTQHPKEEMLIRELVVPTPRQPELKKPEPPRPRQKAQPPVHTAKVKYTNQFDIKKDELVKTPPASVLQLDGKQIGDVDQQGKPQEDKVTVPIPASGGGTGTTDVLVTDPFVAREAAPEFPGGPDALSRFLAKHLRTPGDMEAGEKVMVKIRFRVDVDGSVNGFEILESGGKAYDSEVLRVCKIMPRWKPGFQNGAQVAVNYMIPVTFMGTE